MLYLRANLQTHCMNIKFLFPQRYRLIGWMIAVPSLILMIMVLHFDFTFSFLNYSRGGASDPFGGGTLFTVKSNNFTDEIGAVLLLTGLLLVAFSKEKTEDERTVKIRLESLVWAVYVNSALLILAIIFIYGTLFLEVIVYNICTPLLIFIGRFHYMMYMDRKMLKNEIV